MEDKLYVEEVRSSITRRTNILGLTISEWLAVFLISGEVLLWANRIPRKIFFLRFSHFLFLALSSLLYLGILFLHARKPPRYLAHALRFFFRRKYVMAWGLNEKKVTYLKREL